MNKSDLIKDLFKQLDLPQRKAEKIAVGEKKLTILVATVLILLLPVCSLSDGTVEVRDRSGKLIEKRITRGNRTEVRSPTGKLIRVKIKKKDRVEIRTPTGRLLRTEKTKP